MLLVYLTDRGEVRDTNQDSYCVEIAKRGESNYAMLAVCDGMGGLEQGEVASGAAVQGLRTWFLQYLDSSRDSEMDDQSVFSSWEACIQQIHQCLLTYSERNHIRLGTTLSVIFLAGKYYRVGQVGDSRVYLGGLEGGKLITRDQTLGQQILEKGDITEKELRCDRRQSVLEQCVGQREVKPVYQSGALTAPGWVFLCSDGLYHICTREEICNAVQDAKDRDSLRMGLLQLIAKARDGNECDNITALALKWAEDEYGSRKEPLREQKTASFEILADVVGIHTENG